MSMTYGEGVPKLVRKFGRMEAVDLLQLALGETFFFTPEDSRFLANLLVDDAIEREQNSKGENEVT